MIAALFANVGTPLMFTSACFLFLLNAVIGVIEGNVIARYSGTDRRRAIAIMISANYFSAWSGMVLLAGLQMLLYDHVFTGPPLYAVGSVLGTLLVAALVGSLIIEAPFAVAAGWKDRQSVSRAVKAFILVQTATHIAVTCMFLVVSDLSLFQLRIERHHVLIPRELQGWVYYIRPDERDLWRIRLDGSRQEHITSLHLPQEDDRFPRQDALYVLPAEDGMWNLMVTGLETPILERFATIAGAFVDHGGSEPRSPTWWAADLRPADQRPWHVIAQEFGFAPGLEFKPPMTGQYLQPSFARIGLYHAMGVWTARSATVLPGNFVVLEFKRDQIVVIDAEGKRIAFLAHGRGPVVTLDD
jgi:hypothetical protein